MGKVKYGPEMREQTVKYILESGKSASKTADDNNVLDSATSILYYNWNDNFRCNLTI